MVTNRQFGLDWTLVVVTAVISLSPLKELPLWCPKKPNLSQSNSSCDVHPPSILLVFLYGWRTLLLKRFLIFLNIGIFSSLTFFILLSFMRKVHLVWNFNFSAMKGEPAREEKLKFLIRGGLFAILFTQTKSIKKIKNV